MSTNNVSEEIVLAHYFDEKILQVIDDLIEGGVYPLVYAYIDGVEKFSFIPEKSSEELMAFLDARTNDIRTNRVSSEQELKQGNIFYLTCIDKPEKLAAFYNQYKEVYHCVYQSDIYSGHWWLEIMPKEATKAHEELKKRATAVIGANEEDGVANWLIENY